MDIVICGNSVSSMKQRIGLKNRLQKSGHRILGFCDCDYEIGIPHDNVIKKNIVLNIAESFKIRPLQEWGGVENGVKFVVGDFEPTKVYLIQELQIFLHDHKMGNKIYLWDSRAGKMERLEMDKPSLCYIEYEVSRNCNLKCKGCSHYSNLVKSNEFGDIEKYKKDLLRLSELFSNIGRIRLMGGEPLLNPDLKDFILTSRAIFSKASIEVVSNGLLILKASEELFGTMRKCAAVFDISNYPPTEKMRAKIEEKLEHERIEFTISGRVDEFRVMLSDYVGDSHNNFLHCQGRNCHFLKDGRISLCGQPILYDVSREFLEADRTVYKSDYINIHDADDGYEILHQFKNPIPFCRYCDTTGGDFFKWEGQYTEELQWKWRQKAIKMK